MAKKKVDSNTLRTSILFGIFIPIITTVLCVFCEIVFALDSDSGQEITTLWIIKCIMSYFFPSLIAMGTLFLCQHDLLGESSGLDGKKKYILIFGTVLYSVFYIAYMNYGTKHLWVAIVCLLLSIIYCFVFYYCLNNKVKRKKANRAVSG